MSCPSSYTAIIFDLGDVLFRWSADTRTSISPRTLRNILNSPTWFNYERGQLGEEECYAAISLEFNIPVKEIQQAFRDARNSLVVNHDLIAFLHELKAESNSQLKVYAMSNISRPDWEILRNIPADWSIFDRVFTSGEAGERKPHLGFYRYVLASTDIQSRRAIFIDDKPVNVLSAQSLGFHGIVFDDTSKVRRALRNLIGDPLKRGQNFMSSNAESLHSVTRTTGNQESVVVEENFAQLLILEATGNRDLVNFVEYPRTWNFFQGKGQLTTEDFPFDMDTTSIGLTVLKRDKETADSVMDEILEYVDVDGIVQTYFDHRRPRFDPVVCVNVLSLFYTYGRGSQLERTLHWVRDVLENKAYLDGTRYYETAECFLYFLGRLLASSGDPELHALLKPLLKERVKERIGVKGDALALAMRILTCDFVGLRNEVDYRTLLTLQCEDGGWEVGWIYKYGKSGLGIGNRGLTTALAMKAVEAMVVPALKVTLSPTPVGDNSIRASLLSAGKRSRRGAIKNSLQWLWHGTILRKSVEIES